MTPEHDDPEAPTGGVEGVHALAIAQPVEPSRAAQELIVPQAGVQPKACVVACARPLPPGLPATQLELLVAAMLWNAVQLVARWPLATVIRVTGRRGDGCVQLPRHTLLAMPYRLRGRGYRRAMFANGSPNLEDRHGVAASD